MRASRARWVASLFGLPLLCAAGELLAAPAPQAPRPESHYETAGNDVVVVAADGSRRLTPRLRVAPMS